MKKIVTGAILALLAVALMGAAEATRNTTNVTGAIDNAKEIIIIGETKLTLDTDSGGGGTDSYTCVDRSALEGITGTATEPVGSKTIGAGFSTVGLNLVAGTYDLKCVYDNGTSRTFQKAISAVNPVYTVTTKSAEAGFQTSEVSSVASGDSITINATNSPSGIITGCKFDIVLRPAGATTGNRLAGKSSNESEPFTGRTSDLTSGGTLILAPTTDWPAGNYEFRIDPDGTTCNGIDAESAVLKTLTVTTAGITFTADKTTAAIDDIVKFSGKTTPFKNVTIEVKSGTAANVKVVSADAQVLNGTLSNVESNLQKKNGVTHTWLTVKSDGTFTLELKFDDDGTYEIEATLNGTTEKQSVSVNVADVSATVRTDKTTAILGQEVKITGTVTAGQKVLIAINDKFEGVETVKADKTYEFTWSRTRTSKFSEGSVTIAVWVCPQTVQAGPASSDKCAINLAQGGDVKDGICEKGTGAGPINTSCDTADKKSSDASWSLTLKDQTVEVTSPTAGQQVAEDDDIRITGTAPGATNSKVFAWIFNSKGTTNDGTCFATTISVSSEETGFTFDKQLGKSEVTDDPGDYWLVVQSLGRDGKYSDNTQTNSETGSVDTDPIEIDKDKSLFCNDDSTQNSILTNKVGSQILAILQDNALNKAGSDDQKVFKVVQFKVVTPSIKLNACPATIKGADMNVSGTSNRADGTTVIVKATGPKELPPKTTTVQNGTFSATFTAAEIGEDIGTYTVTADDLKGKTDSVTCSVISGEACSLSVTVTSDKTSVEKDETAKLTATLSNAGDEACTGTSLTSAVDPATGTVSWDETSVDVPGKGSATVSGNFSASADGTYTVTLTATRGAETANGSATITVGAATPAPTPTEATPTPAASPTPAATPKPSPPGFEAVFAIAGLLAVAYLVNRRKR